LIGSEKDLPRLSCLDYLKACRRPMMITVAREQIRSFLNFLQVIKGGKPEGEKEGSLTLGNQSLMRVEP
jgi:hypothetical protein